MIEELDVMLFNNVKIWKKILKNWNTVHVDYPKAELNEIHKRTDPPSFHL